MFFSLLRNKFSAILVGLPFYVSAFISGLNISVDLRVRRILTFNDYIFYLVHQIDRALKPVFFFSFFPFIGLFVIVRKSDFRKKRTRKNIYAAIFLLLILLIGIWGKNTQEYLAAANGNSLLIEQIQIIVVFTFSISFMLLKTDRFQGVGRLGISQIYDENYDAWLFVFMLVIIFLDGLQLGYVISHGVPARLLACDAEETRNIQLIGALERGVAIKLTDDVKIISYDCLKIMNIY